MSENLKDAGKAVGAALGTAPNEIFSRTGQILSIFSAVALLGINVTGVESGEHTIAAPYVTLFTGIFCMWYGGKLKGQYYQKVQDHELNLERERNENTRGSNTTGRE